MIFSDNRRHPRIASKGKLFGIMRKRGKTYE